MTKIKRVLMLAHPEVDYVAYMMYNGLYKILGKDNLCIYPYIKHYQGGIDDWYTLSDGKRGYTIPPAHIAKHDTPEKSFDDIVNNIHSFDIIYLSSGRSYTLRSLEQLIARCGRNNLPPLILSEGEDYQEMTTIRDIKNKYNPIVCFKRELIQSDLDNNTDLHPLYPLPCSSIIDGFPVDNLNKDIDIFAVFGDTSQRREDIVKLINSSYLPEKYNVYVKIYYYRDIPEIKTPWGDKRQLGTHQPLPYLVYLDYMSRAKINIVARGWGHESMRRFEAPYFSGLVLSDNIPILTPNPFINNENIVYYDNDLSNLIVLIEYYLGNSSERERIGKAGREHCIKYHTTEARTMYFLDKIEKHI